MHTLLAKLNESKRVLDLGCGRGSFHYEAYRFQTLATDLHLAQDTVSARKDRVFYFRSEATTIPLAATSVDVVICHNTLEHFADYEETLKEIRRVLRPDGWLWIAVPNGYGLDDALYRYIFEGGGHVNRFTFGGLIADVERMTGLRLVQACDLFSGFVFLKKPTPEEAAGYPRTAHFLANIPDGFGTMAVVGLNTATRLVDKLVGTRWSQYGWGFIFASAQAPEDRLPSFFNVCRKCGSGISEEHIRTFARSFIGLRPYKCPSCGETNIFVKPPAGLD